MNNSQKPSKKQKVEPKLPAKSSEHAIISKSIDELKKTAAKAVARETIQRVHAHAGLIRHAIALTRSIMEHPRTVGQVADPSEAMLEVKKRFARLAKVTGPFTGHKFSLPQRIRQAAKEEIGDPCFITLPGKEPQVIELHGKAFISSVLSEKELAKLVPFATAEPRMLINDTDVSHLLPSLSFARPAKGRDVQYIPSFTISETTRTRLARALRVEASSIKEDVIAVAVGKNAYIPPTRVDKDGEGADTLLWRVNGFASVVAFPEIGEPVAVPNQAVISLSQNTGYSALSTEEETLVLARFTVARAEAVVVREDQARTNLMTAVRALSTPFALLIDPERADMVLSLRSVIQEVFSDSKYSIKCANVRWQEEKKTVYELAAPCREMMDNGFGGLASCFEVIDGEPEDGFALSSSAKRRFYDLGHGDPANLSSAASQCAFISLAIEVCTIGEDDEGEGEDLSDEGGEGDREDEQADGEGDDDDEEEAEDE